MQYTRHMIAAMLLVVVQLLAGSNIVAQNTTGATQVKLVDEDGQPVTGALVVARGQGRPLSLTSDDRGYARFLSLPVGTYTIEVRSMRHRPVTIRGVTVRLGQTTSQDVTLVARATALEPVIVEARRPLIDVTSTTAGITLTRTEVDELPVAREYHAIATLAPHTNVSFLGDDINVAGGTGFENSYFIDGVNVTDVYGIRASGMRLPYNFIRDIEVRTGAYKAEHRSALGGILNVVTPTGTNSVRGEIFAFGVHNKLSAPPRHGLIEPESRGAYAADFGGSIGGPVVRDRVWFFGAYNRAVESDEVMLPGLGFYRDREIGNRFAGKLTWQPAAATNATFTVLGDPSTRIAVGSTLGAYGPAVRLTSPDPALGNLRRGGVTTALQVRHLLNTSLMLEVSGSRLAARDDNAPATALGAAELFFTDGPTGTRSGGYPENVRLRTTRTSAGSAATLLLEKHTTKVGAELVDNGLRQHSTQQALWFIDPALPLPYFFWLADAHGSVHNRVLSLYGQDDWRPTERLTINAGARWDHQSLIDSRGAPVLRISGELQPRVGIVYQPGKLGTQKVSASFGRFSQDLHLAASALYHDYSNVFAFILYGQDPRTDTTGAVGGPLVFETDGDRLKGQYHDEWTVGYERVMGAGISVGVRAISRRLREGIEDANDPATGVTVLGNPGRGRLDHCPRMRRDYNALEVTASGSPSDNISMLGSYVLSRTYGNYGGLFNADFGYLYANRNGWYDHCDEPSQFSTGDLPSDRRHVFKLAGSWNPSRRITLGSFLLWSSGTPVSELGGSVHGAPYATFIGRRGSAGRTPSLFDLNLRLAYHLPIMTRAGSGPTMLMDVFHLGSSRRAVAVDQLHYLGLDQQGSQAFPNVTYGRATRYAPSMSARLGLIAPF